MERGTQLWNATWNAEHFFLPPYPKIVQRYQWVLNLRSKPRSLERRRERERVKKASDKEKSEAKNTVFPLIYQWVLNLRSKLRSQTSLRSRFFEAVSWVEPPNKRIRHA